MNKTNNTIIVSLCCIVFSAAFAGAFPNICIPGSCDGELRDGSDVLRGSFSNWVGLADTTSSGDWSYDDPVAGTVQSTNAEGNYIFDPDTVSATATYIGDANFPANPGLGSSSYTMQLTLTFPNGGYCDGTWSIDFDNPLWPDLSGTWLHTSRYSAPIADHVFAIYIDSGIIYHDAYNPADFSYDFDIDEIETDDTVDLIRITTPGTPPSVSGITFDIPKLPNQWDEINRIYSNYEYDPIEEVAFWEYSKAADSQTDLDQYGNGWYDITVFYNGGGSDTTKVWFGIPAENAFILQPTQRINLISPSNYQRLLSPVTFVWDLCTDLNATNVYLGLEGKMNSDDIEFILPVTATTQGPVVMKDGFCEVYISLDNWHDVPHNADGVPYEVLKYHESENIIGVGVVSDINGDNIVNYGDFARSAADWLNTECYNFNGYCKRADVNFYTNVNFDDLLIIVYDWLDVPLNP